MLDDKGDEEGVYIENNTGRLFVDGDGLASRINTKSARIDASNVEHIILSNLMSKK